MILQGFVKIGQAVLENMKYQNVYDDNNLDDNNSENNDKQKKKV